MVDTNQANVAGPILYELEQQHKTIDDLLARFTDAQLKSAQFTPAATDMMQYKHASDTLYDMVTNPRGLPHTSVWNQALAQTKTAYNKVVKHLKNANMGLVMAGRAGTGKYAKFANKTKRKIKQNIAEKKPCMASFGRQVSQHVARGIPLDKLIQEYTGHGMQLDKLIDATPKAAHAELWIKFGTQVQKSMVN